MGVSPLVKDAAITIVLGPALDDTDFKSIESVAYNAPGIAVQLHRKAANGVVTDTAITPSTTNNDSNNYWVAGTGGYHTLRITAAQNSVQGDLWATAQATGVLPFESPHYAVNPPLSAQEKLDAKAEADSAVSDNETISKLAGMIEQVT